ncbi:M48 family metallopeptidase [Streptomyces asoensis]
MMRRRFRVATAAALLFGFYMLVAGGVALWLLLLGVSLWLTVFTTRPAPVQLFLTCAGTAPLAVALAAAAYRTIFDTSDVPEEEVLVDSGQAPHLDRLVREVAAELGTEAPSAIRLTVDVNASVIETDTRFLGLGRGNRCLVIGLPLLVMLTQDQVRAVLAHELAHFSLGHSRARAFTRRLETSLEIAEDSFGRMGDANGLVRQYRGLPLLFAAGYQRFARLLTGATRRRQEEEADKEAVRLYGVDLFADALRAKADAALAWPAFRKAFLDPKRGLTGRRPDDPFRVFAMIVASPGMRACLARLRPSAASKPRSSACGEFHADFATRIKAARTAGTRTARPAAAHVCPEDLLPDVLYENDLDQLLPEGKGAQLMPWRDWVASVAQRRAARLVGALMDAVNDVSGGANDSVSLQQVTTLLDAGERMSLARALGSRLPHKHRRSDDPLSALVTAITALVSALLVSTRGATWQIDWTGGVTAEPADGTPSRDVRTWVEEAVLHPDRSTWLTFRLAEQGLDDRTPARRLPARSADDGKTAEDFVLAEVETSIPESTRHLVSVLRSATLSVIIGGVLLASVVSLTQGREWLRHDTTRSDTYTQPGGTGYGVGPTTQEPFPSWSPTLLPPTTDALLPPPSILSTPLLPKPLDMGPFASP